MTRRLWRRFARLMTARVGRTASFGRARFGRRTRGSGVASADTCPTGNKRAVISEELRPLHRYRDFERAVNFPGAPARTGDDGLSLEATPHAATVVLAARDAVGLLCLAEAMAVVQ